MTNILKEAAINYAKMGFAVFPLKPNSKHPQTRHGFKDATTNVSQVEKWWNLLPNCNIGIATGNASGGICVVDVDVNDEKGIDGRDSISDWERNNGRLPDTAISITGRGGYHYFYRFSETQKCRTGIIDGVDFRAEGGYIVAPPSIHENGNEYQWEYDVTEFPVAEADEYVIKLISSGKSTEGGEAVEKLDPKALISEGGRNDGLYRLACHYQSFAYADDDIRVLVHNINKQCCNPPLESDEVDKILSSAFGWVKGKSDGYKFKHYDKYHQNINDIVEAIENDELLSKAIHYNTLAYTPWIAGKLPWSDTDQREWTDADDANYFAYMEQYGFKSHDKMMDALTIVMDKNKFSPILEHFKTLKWDGKHRVDTLLVDWLGAADTELNRAIMRVYMYGAIARVVHPGCQFDYTLILVGDQGIGKSTFLRRLAMRDCWFDGNFGTIDGAQAVEKLRGMWILEMSELLAMKRAKDIEATKSFLTNRADNYRAPYARRTAVRPRQCVFAGTANTEDFLTDTTGNRRFLPVMTNLEQAKLDLLNEEEQKIMDYFEQAWAEAYHDFTTQHPKLVLSKEMQKAMKKVQEQFTEDDVRIGIIEEYLQSHTRVCVAELWESALEEKGKPDKKTSNQLHQIMKNIDGWRFAGRLKCGKYGQQRCYEPDSAWKEVPESEVVPF